MSSTECWLAAWGVCVGVFLDRCVRRLAFEKSIFFPPRRHCTRCLQPVSPWSAVPLVGRFLAGGRCRACGEILPWRTILLQLLTAAAFVGLYRLHVLGKGQYLPAEAHFQNHYALHHLQALAVYHGLLFCFLLVASTVDWDLTLIPLSSTIVGSLVGIALGTFWYVELHPLPLWFAHTSQIPRAAEWANANVWTDVFRWWTGQKTAALPASWEAVRAFAYPHWDLNWNRYLGAATGIAGWLAGYVMVWAIDVAATKALGRDAMGIGDRDLLAMIGAYLGWQSAVLVFFIAAVVPGMLAALATALLRRGGHIPFGPHLALGAGLCVAWWRPIFDATRDVFMTFGVFFGVALGLLVAFYFTALLVGWLKGLVMAGRRGVA